MLLFSASGRQSRSGRRGLPRVKGTAVSAASSAWSSSQRLHRGVSVHDSSTAGCGPELPSPENPLPRSRQEE